MDYFDKRCIYKHITPAIRKRLTIIITIVCTFFLISSIRAADVNFNLNLANLISKGQFNVGTDQVNVIGSFTTTTLSDPDGDNIYSALVTGLADESLITYNFRVTRSANTINETVNH